MFMLMFIFFYKHFYVKVISFEINTINIVFNSTFFIFMKLCVLDLSIKIDFFRICILNNFLRVTFEFKVTEFLVVI